MGEQYNSSLRHWPENKDKQTNFKRERKLKGKDKYVVDYCNNTIGFVGAGLGNQLHDGRSDPCPAGGRPCHDTGKLLSGPTP